MTNPELSKPGETGESLADDGDVIRMLLVQSDYRHINSNTFALSGEEKDLAEEESGWARSSVYETSLTTPEQANGMMTKCRPGVVRLSVADIRSLPIKDEGCTLDVVWDRMADCLDAAGNPVPERKPGCEGHCGITDKPMITRGPFSPKVQRALSKLADNSPKQFLDAP